MLYTDFSQIIHSWQGLHRPFQDTATLTESISHFLNGASGAKLRRGALIQSEVGSGLSAVGKRDERAANASDISAPQERVKRRHKEMRLREEKKGGTSRLMQKQGTGVDSEKTCLSAKSNARKCRAPSLRSIKKRVWRLSQGSDSRRWWTKHYKRLPHKDP